MLVNAPITVGAWALVQEECEIEYVVCDDTVEFTFGARGTNLQLITDEEMLEGFLAKGAEALQSLRNPDRAL